MVTKERRRLLQEQYYFTCQCEACSPKEASDSKLGESCTLRANKSGILCPKCQRPVQKVSENGGGMFLCSVSACGHQMSPCQVNQKLEEVEVALETAVQLMERDMPAESLALLKRTKGRSGKILGERHPLQGALADATARAYASMCDWESAAVYLEQSTAATSFQFGQDSIELGQQLFKLAQLHFNSGARGPALSVISRTKEIFSLHCGPHCPEIQELNAMQECLQL